MLTTKVKPGDELAERQGVRHSRVRVAGVTAKYITLEDGRKFFPDGQAKESNYANGELLALTPETEAAIQKSHDRDVISHYNLRKWYDLPPDVLRKIVAAIEEHENA